ANVSCFKLDLVISQLKDDADNVELQSLKAELEQMISLLDESLAELKPKESQPAAKSSTTRFNKVASTPADQPSSVPTANDDEVVTYQVNDTVSARWVSGDRGWYPARITLIAGSATAPMYTVKFKSYDTTETVRARDIRPINNKRKADNISTGADHPASGSTTAAVSGASTPAVATATSTFSPIPNASKSATGAGTVVSAAASVYPEQMAKMKAQQSTLDGEVKPKKAKKIKANKELEAGKSKWQEFSTKSKFAKTQKKDSMFRTPDGINGRVGFTGSGKAMRKDTARTRHVYQPTDDLD
ncbi:hypothetical protein TD95_004943, partial [Thielaviopsis punctulata]